MNVIYITIKLTLAQMVNLGIHIGHSLLLSKFLSYWMFGGWRSNIFIINILKSVFLFKMIIQSIYFIIFNRKPLWFINVNSNMNIYIHRYAALAAEPYCTYKWINGMLTNFRVLFNWNNVLKNLLKLDKYEMRVADKKKLLAFHGFSLHRKMPAFIGFVTSMKYALKPLEEFWCLDLPCISVVDSDMISWNVSMPIPGNDSSFLCSNYYSYLVAKTILYSKVFLIKKYKENIIALQSIDYLEFLAMKKKSLLFYLYSKNKSENTKILNSFMKKKIMDLEKYKLSFKFNYKIALLDLKMFNTVYSVFKNKNWFDFILPDEREIIGETIDYNISKDNIFKIF